MFSYRKNFSNISGVKNLECLKRFGCDQKVLYLSINSSILWRKVNCVSWRSELQQINLYLWSLAIYEPTYRTCLRIFGIICYQSILCKQYMYIHVSTSFARGKHAKLLAVKRSWRRYKRSFWKTIRHISQSRMVKLRTTVPLKYPSSRMVIGRIEN